MIIKGLTMSNISKGRGYVYSLQYHVVWCVKYRHKILDGDIGSDLHYILHRVADDNEFQITELNMGLDHVHLLIDCRPQHYIPNMIKALKGVSGRYLMQKYGDELRGKLWGGHIWDPSYFVATVSENTGSQVREYIQNQKRV